MIWAFVGLIALGGVGWLAWEVITAPDEASFIDHENDYE
jgi:hypothetical protein